MADPFFSDVEKLQDELSDEERRECDLVAAMTATDGWEIIRSRLVALETAHTRSLLNIPIIPENLGEIALAQSKANACKMIFDIVDGFKNRRLEILRMEEE